MASPARGPPSVVAPTEDLGSAAPPGSVGGGASVYGGSADGRGGGGGSPGKFDSKLLQARQGRKMVEQDATMLLNRIMLLKHEESKVWRKIDKTRAKATEILHARISNEERLAARQALEHRAAEEDEKAIVRNAAIRERQEAVRMKRAEAEERERRKRVLDLKAEKEHHRIAMEEDRAAAEAAIKAKAAAIRLELDRARRRRQQLEEEKMRKAREDYELRVREEEEKRIEKENEVSRLEKLELKLIDKLRTAQDIQQQAYEDLEDALAGKM